MTSTTSITYPDSINNPTYGLVFCVSGAVLVFILIFVCCGYGCLKKRKLEAQIRKEAKMEARARRQEEFTMIDVPSKVYSAKY
ncbi:hypothetical protein OCU04_012092 [Sclerotinia nivalis]|uniref:Uncharacterized protein n=1 Tax=Sclerotinia nivalis TaxID=352851 RepID=A0A9X0DE19_9HELO|nr:hypothetical protein OCU04_012092 [Sclerotinia nivalis]